MAYYNKITSEGTIDYQKKFWYEENGQKVFITEQEYNKINLRDRFWLVRKNSVNDKIFDAWYSLTNQVSYKDNLINADEGVLIPLPENILYGELTFDICAPDSLGTIQNYRTDKEENYTYATYCHIKTLDFIYTNNKHYIDTFNQNQYDPDTLYSNVIDSENVTELDDLTLKVNTYTEKAGSYSYVITQNGTAYDYVDTLHNIARSNDLKQEETIIQKYANYYSTPKFIYSNTLNNKEVKPYTVIHENTLNRNLVVNSTTYNLSTNSVSIVATEL